MYSIIEKHYLNNYKNMVKRVKFRVNTQEDAEDVMQEAYTRALRYSNSFDMGTPFNHWFLRIVSNVVKDHLAEKYGRAGHEEFDEEKVEPLVDNTFMSRHSGVLAKIISSIEDEEKKEILSLHFLYGFNIRDIVQITNLRRAVVDGCINNFKRATRGEQS